MNGDITSIDYLPTSPTNSFLFTCTSNVSCGDITLPTYAKGILICANSINYYSYDAVVMAVDASLNFYIGFRNGTAWYGRKI